MPFIWFYLSVQFSFPSSSLLPTLGNIKHICLVFLRDSSCMPRSLFMHMPQPVRILSFLLLLKSSPIKTLAFQDSLSLPTLSQCLLGSIQLKVISPSCAVCHYLAYNPYKALISVIYWPEVWGFGYMYFLLHSLPTLDSTFPKVKINFS